MQLDPVNLLEKGTRIKKAPALLKHTTLKCILFLLEVGDSCEHEGTWRRRMLEYPEVAKLDHQDHSGILAEVC